MKNTILAALLAICAGAALVSCNKEESEIVGEWKCTDVELYYGDTEIGFNPASDCVYVLGDDSGWTGPVYSPSTDAGYWSSITLSFNEDGSGTYNDEYMTADMEWEQTGMKVSIILYSGDESAAMDLMLEDGRISIPAEDYMYAGVYGYHVGEESETVSEWSGQDGKPHLLLGYYILTR